MAPDISVVVPTRNRAELVARLLHQLASLDPGPSYEVIVVDEGSSDGTPDLLRRFADLHGFTIIRHDEPRGLPAARNAGLDAATGEYIAWIDDDDLTSPDRLRRQHEALTAGTAGWSCSARVDIDDDLTIIGHYRCPDPDGALLPRLLRFNCLPTAAQGLLVERALAADLGGYDESLRSAEDWEFCIRLCERGDPHLLDEPLVGYRTGVASMSTDTARMDEAISAVAAKHRGLYERHGVEPDWSRVHESLMAAELLGSRWRAAARAVRCFADEPTVHRALRCPLVLVAPKWFAARSARRRVDQVPADWIRRANIWLRPPSG